MVQLFFYRLPFTLCGEQVFLLPLESLGEVFKVTEVVLSLDRQDFRRSLSGFQLRAARTWLRPWSRVPEVPSEMQPRAASSTCANGISWCVFYSNVIIKTVFIYALE